MNNSPHTAVPVFGMHRSGTSFLASFIESFGVHMGSNLVGPRLGNPRGHFEDVEFLNFHHALLHRTCSTQGRVFDDGMMAQHMQDFAPTQEELTAATELINRRRALGKPWGWKEPRTSLYAKFWLNLLPEAKPIWIYRHPLDVHFSMLKRQHWDILLYPNQVCTAYSVYQKSIEESWQNRPQDFLILNATASFQNLGELEDLVCKHLGMTSSPGERSRFHPEEFSGIAVSPAMHRVFALISPSAASAFDLLQQRATVPQELKASANDSWWDSLHDFLEPTLRGLNEKSRACFLPLIESHACSDDPEKLTELRAHICEQMSDKIRRTEAWNARANKIHAENSRLFAEKELLGKRFAEQQKFLEQQERSQKAYIKELEGKLENIWNELVSVGQDWERKVALIAELESRLAQEEVNVL
jgi:hypothetical protein